MLKLVLAPMEGVFDSIFRDIMTHIGGIDRCVTEFIRVTDHVHSDHIFYKYCPELKNKSLTPAGVPVVVQFLGSDIEMLAANAYRAIELGATGIDLNFGCPAKRVNNHDGGAALLKCPDRIQNIVAAVRKAVPTHIPVSAKIRLGYDDPATCIENAMAVEAGGANYLTVHCRTRTDMYKPPAYWEWIPKIKEKVKLNIVANGEIWNVEDALRCHTVTGCNEIMIGRGAVADPFIFLKIKGDLSVYDWNHTQKLLPQFYDQSLQHRGDGFAIARTKLWLSYISKRDPVAREHFNRIKVITKPVEFREQLAPI